MSRSVCVAGLLLALCGNACAGDLTGIDRRIKKEPAYAGKAQRYVLLAIGPQARDLVWLVKDGPVLYVDRNGNGDLTEPGKKVLAKKGGSDEDGWDFSLDELTVGGRSHARLRAAFLPLKKVLFGRFAQRPNARAALRKNPDAEVLAALVLEVALPRLKAKGRVLTTAGGFDLNGPLIPARKAAEAPIIHLGGPLQLTFADHAPALRRNRSVEFSLVVGTPGLGPGTFCAIGYDETIPPSAHPKCEISFPPAGKGANGVKRVYELKQRC
jgi:hypothetical protein